MSVFFDSKFLLGFLDHATLGRRRTQQGSTRLVAQLESCRGFARVYLELLLQCHVRLRCR